MNFVCRSNPFRIALLVLHFPILLSVGYGQGQWQFHDGRDQMSGARKISATFIEDIESNGRIGQLQVLGGCDLENANLTLNFTYLSKSRDGVGFYLRQMPNRAPFAFFRVKLDGGAVHTVVASSEYSNRAAVVFYENGPTVTSSPPIGENLHELARTQNIKFEFTLDNSDTPIFEMNPQDRAFQQFVSICLNKGADTSQPKPIIGSRSPGRTYSAKEFIALLPNALQKAALDRGFDAHAYDKELKFISDAINTCAQITPQMATDPAAPGRDAPIWYKFGKQYAICTNLALAGVDTSEESGNTHGPAGNPQQPKNNHVMLRIGQPIGQFYREGKGFQVSINILYRDPALFEHVNIAQNP